MPPNTAPAGPDAPAPGRPARGLGVAAGALGVLALLAAVIVLGFSYLSVRETSIGSDLSQSDPTQALHALNIAADLNPLSADPARLAGSIALANQRYETARQRFGQATSRDPGGWYGWFGRRPGGVRPGRSGAGAPRLPDRPSINPRQAVIARALEEVDTKDPLAPATALQLLAQSL